VKDERGLHIHVQKTGIPRDTSIKVGNRWGETTHIPTLRGEKSARGEGSANRVVNSKFLGGVSERGNNLPVRYRPIGVNLSPRGISALEGQVKLPINETRKIQSNRIRRYTISIEPGGAIDAYSVRGDDRGAKRRSSLQSTRRSNANQGQRSRPFGDPRQGCGINLGESR
jgi:hypothetical protein